MISEPREAADVPISPLPPINQADMSTAMGHEGMQLPGMSYQDDISLKSPPALSTGPNNAKPKCRQKKITSDDVLRLQYETLECKKETLLLKKAKLELQIKLLENQLP